MKKISTLNKLFIVFCASLIVFISITIPHEIEPKQKDIKNSSLNKLSEE